MFDLQTDRQTDKVIYLKKQNKGSVQKNNIMPKK